MQHTINTLQTLLKTLEAEMYDQIDDNTGMVKSGSSEKFNDIIRLQDNIKTILPELEARSKKEKRPAELIGTPLERYCYVCGHDNGSWVSGCNQCKHSFCE